MKGRDCDGMLYGPRHVCIPHVRRQFFQVARDLCLDPPVPQERPHVLVPVAEVVVVPSHLADRLHEVKR